LVNFGLGAVVGTTPTTYSNPRCFKAFVFDLGTVPTAFPGSVSSPYIISVDWTDPWPRSQAQCVTTLGVQVYTPQFSWGPVVVGSEWKNGACNLGSISFGRGSTVNNGSIAPDLGGKSVRLSVTARTAANSTQSVKVTYTVTNSILPPCPEC
jgi:hypothetical protein